ncbi:uncharacterized protein TrAFT101_003108 [Trichoderma asperellum]|uniref:Ketoreductase (KR) domain-containing protein n=1 Tax=Trichoderma asperellum (strain ATCC 204424 / CBS 433.97 / NBRC 101777) TaxID=1042311 RepID=A0A2T3ZID0_TRIA4|nr:hypothetical protein M441DRAFT_454152 [Trichoderma asperellum CBS 433.97]PTB44557.1 hypothetical protein M441DRAFT_454152 [Trichoderma asperellum CBS 433.97]UKZ87300.1 hypothetical protein TrAFT101_003108 [Trichoderma asperellum]
MPSSNFSPSSIPDLSGRVYLVTGGNAGCGKETVIGLAARGAKVFMGARSKDKAIAAIEEIQETYPSADIHFLDLDLSNFSSVMAAAKKIRDEETALHGLVNNAGIMGVPYSVTADGYEIQLQTNYLSHWLLTYHLLPLLQSTARSNPEGTVRLANLTSDGHARFPPSDGIHFEDLGLEKEGSMKRYCQSKLANILHTAQLNKRYGPDSSESQNGAVWFAAVHPGHINTDLNKQATGTAPGFVLRSVTPVMRCLGILDAQEKGAWSSLFAIASSDFKKSDSGAYIVPYAKIGTPSKHAQDESLAEKLWQWTETELRGKGLLE